MTIIARLASLIVLCASAQAQLRLNQIQVIGSPQASDEALVVDGSLEELRFVVAYGRGGRLTGALGCSRPRQLMAYRPLLERGAPLDEALALTPS